MSTHFTITSYKDLEQWADAFTNKDGLPLLFLVGHPGTGKSNAFKARLTGDLRYINAVHMTDFQMYKELYRSRNMPIVLDDVDEALKNRGIVRMLMALCETDDAARLVAWLGTESMLTTRKGSKLVRVPQEFQTTSRVCVISNDWSILTSKFGALLDRGTIVFFDPDAAEIHRHAGWWFLDQEVYTFIGEHLDIIGRHSFRSYVRAANLKRLGLDWKAVLLETWTNDQARCSRTEALVKRLLADPTYKTDAERIEAFMAHPDGGCRRTWFNIKKKLDGNGDGRPAR
jgi:hypothetical protein